MSKLGYLFLGLVIAALAIFVFRPEHDGPSGITLASGPLPETFTASIDGVEQRVENRVVHVQGLELPLSYDHANSLWNLLTALVLSKDRVIDRVAATDLAAYGIDGRSRIEAGSLTLQFGK
jgi:hypothetical protein